MRYFLLFLLFSCASMKEQMPPPVTNFNINTYFGTWYEIARLENSFEKGCEQVFAEYLPREDGGIEVINNCMKNGKFKQANGRGYFKGEPNVGLLKVTFFWPFYGEYRIIELSDGYSVVTSSSRGYLWILSRTKMLPQETLNGILARLEQNKFEIQKLHFTKQS